MHYDPTTTVFTLIDKDLDLNEIHQEIKKVKAAAEKWLNPSLSWDELDDEEKQAVDEDRLVEEISDDYSSGDTEEAIERLEDLGLDIGDLNL
jgi:superoxide dismutase